MKKFSKFLSLILAIAMVLSMCPVMNLTAFADEVTTTESEAIEAEVTEPEVTEPEVTEPEVTEPEVTEPEVTEPEVTEPEVTEPEVTEPEVTEPEVTEPEATEPEVTEPEVTEPEVTEPEVTEPEVTEPEVTEPEVTVPEVTEPEVTEPEVTEPEVTEPEVTEPEVTEPEVTEPEVTEPEVITYTVTLTEGENYTIAPADGYTATVEENGEFKFTVTPAEGYTVASVLAGETELTAGEDGVYTITVTADVTVTVTVSDGKLHGGETITEDGTYQLAEDANGAITIAAGVTDVVIVGNGVVYDSDATTANYGAISSTPVSITINAAAAPGVHLTLQDVYNSITAWTTNMIDFSGTGNRLTIKGTCLLDYDIGFRSSNNAGIHVALGTTLTIDGDGTLYMYKNSQGAGIGGATKEMNGDITFAMTGYLYIKGTRQGAVIGAGSGASSSTDAPGAVTFESGSYNIITNSRGAAIGGSAGSTGGSTGTVVNVYPGATLSINTDYSGAAIGGGGYAQGNDSSGGTLYVYGGSIRPYVDKNAASNVTTGWNGKTLTEGINDAIITAQRLDSLGNTVYMCIVDISEIAANTDGLYGVTVDGSETAFYNGPGHAYSYAFDGIDRSTETSSYPLTTISNWLPEKDTNLYLYLTGADHTIDINGTSVTYYWDPLTETFDTVKHANVTFYVSAGGTDLTDATIILSDGIGYTYLEQTHEGYFFEAVEAVEADAENGIEAVEAEAAKTMFSLVPGEYTFTITRNGYYASTGSFTVSEAGHAVSSNIYTYLLDDVFTIPMTAFTPSTNEGAWDSVTIDVSWYSETAKELHISTPAQLAGMAAIVNGIYNAETTTVIDDVNGDGITETYTPYDYAHLDGCKIIAASSGGSTGTNNLVSTLTYWYGAKSTGTYTTDDGEVLPLPSDFNGKTVYIDCDLDMGGYQTSDGTWAGARYMTIGGQSLMHYIDYSAWMSDGYSHIGSSFNGTLDGQGHIIKNMYCDRYADGSSYGDSVSVGLVGRLGCHDGDSLTLMAVDPTVRNIAVTGYVYGRRSVGGIVGKTGQTSASKLGDGSTGAIIENCLNFAEVRNTDAKGVGGICGAGWNEGVIRNCANFGYIYAGYKNAGGICGSCEVPVINCYNVGYVDAISYNYGQAMGTDNGGSVYTNVYWLTGSSIADSVDTYKYPAVYTHDSKDTITEITTFAGFTTADFLANLNGNYREWVFASETDAISAVMSAVTFSNCLLETTVTDEDGTATAISAAGMPVPRSFTTDATTITGIEKTSDPTDLEYIATQSFDDTGLEIWATWSDGTRELVEDYTVSPAGALTTEDTVVTVSGTRGGMEYSYSFDITVTANELTRIAFKTKPYNLVYGLGEEFDPTGMVVTAYYTSAPSTAVTLDAEDYTAEFIEDEEGNTNLVVSHTYNGTTLTLSVAVTIMDTPAPILNEDGYYELTCTNDVLWFANQVSKVRNTAINGKVMADITMASDFAGIGTSSYAYAGIFDGNGYTITLSTSLTASCALFTAVSGGTIRNVTVDGSVTSTSTSAGIAGIAAYVTGNGATITDCVNKAAISGPQYVGGIVGKVQSAKEAVTISNCRNEGTISATGTQSGGIVGYLNYYSSSTGLLTVTDCVNAGRIISSSSNVGGIVGYMTSYSATQYSLVQNCANEAPVTGYYNVGGIVGQSFNTYDRINSCYNLGDVTSNYGASQKPVGGVVGYLKGSVKNVYNLGSVSCAHTSAVSGAGIGGVVGMTYLANTSIVNAYNAGTVTSSGSGIPSGVLGYARYATTLTNCHYLEGTADVAVGYVYSGIVITGEPAVQTDAALKALAETLGDEFKDTHPCYNSGYPVLTWQADPEASQLVHSYTEDGFCGGCGVYDPDAAAYTVRTAENLKTIADAVNAGDTLKGKTVTLAADISLAGYDWAPIGGAAENVALTINSQTDLDDAIAKYNLIYDNHGNSYKYGTDKNLTYVESYSYYYVNGQIFSGIFNGAGYTISDLSVNTSSGYAGLFGNVDGVVKNFTLTGSVTSSTSTDFVGGVAGKLSEGGTIQGITANVTVTAAKCYNVGGIVGFLGTKDATASNPFTSANNTLVSECVNLGSVTGYSQVGGITGENAGMILRCVNHGTVQAKKTGSKAGIGGIAGRNGCNNTAYTKGTIIDCYNTGTIGSSANKWVGGIAGLNNAASSIKNCYNVGTVYGSGQANAICGQNEAMSSYSAIISNCWYLDSTKVFDADGVYGGIYEDCGSKTEAEMKDPSFAAILGLNFNVDSDNINNGYPILDWQGGTAAPNLYTVTIPSGGDGYTVAIADGCSTTVVEGGEFKFSVYLLEGYALTSVTAGDTVLTAVSGVYTIENITSDVTVAIVCEVISEEEPEIELFDLSGATATLGNSLAINFVVNTEKLDGDGHYAVITRSYADGTTVTERIEQADWIEYSGKLYYFSYSGIRAKEMTDEMSVIVYNSDDVQVTNEWTDSLRDYAMRALGNEEKKSSPDAEKLALYVDMLNYGAAAQVYFDNYHGDDLANSRLTEAQKAYATTEAEGEDIRQTDVGYAGATLILADEIVLNFVYENTFLADVSYAVATFEDHYGDPMSVRVEAENFGYFSSTRSYVSVNGMKIADYAQAVTLTLYDADGNALSTVVDSVGGYITRVTNPSELYTMILRFGVSAYNSFHD